MFDLNAITPSPDAEAAVLRAFKRGESINPEHTFAAAWTVGRGFVVFYPSIAGAGMFAVLSPIGRLRLDEIAATRPDLARGLPVLGPRCLVRP